MEDWPRRFLLEVKKFERGQNFEREVIDTIQAIRSRMGPTPGYHTGGEITEGDVERWLKEGWICQRVSNAIIRSAVSEEILNIDQCELPTPKACRALCKRLRLDNPQHH